MHRRLSLLACACVLTLGLVPASEAHAAPRYVALSFDDGPSATLTPVVLATLRAKGARALFCVQGAHGEQLRDLVRREVAEGHDLCGHSWTHPHFPLIPRDAVRQAGEVAATWRLLGYLGDTPELFRYPYGQPTAYADGWVTQMGMTRLRWDDQTVSADWGCPGAAEVVRRVMAGVRPGSVILLHDGNQAVSCGAGQLAYLPVLIDRLRAAGYTLGRVVPSATYSAANQSYVQVVPF
jgi:peptidoglycan/xylan/chitin deacetylase (PgdA/CDA1 family)